MADDDIQDEDADEGGSTDDVSLKPNENADPQEIVDLKVPQSIRDKYEVFSYRNAAVILAETRQQEYAEIVSALEAFTITTKMIRTAGGNESDIPKSSQKLCARWAGTKRTSAPICMSHCRGVSRPAR